MARIVRTDCELATPLVDRALREAGHELVLLPHGIGEDALAAAVAEAELLLMCYTPVTARVIAAAPKLRGIVKYGVGIDAIDIPAAHARGIVVVNVPDYAEETVAEAAFALMIALMKRLPALSRQMAREGWAWPEPRWLASDLAGKTLGIVGCGRIGRAMARMAAGFRMEILGHDPHVSPEMLIAAGIRPAASLTELLERADVVSLHAVLTPETRHLIGAPELALMKPTAILVNTARGALVDEVALLAALREGRIAGAGLDVFSEEPLARAGHPLSPLFEMENVILTPHLAFYTAEAMARLERETLERCFEILEGREVLIRSADPRLRPPPR